MADAMNDLAAEKAGNLSKVVELRSEGTTTILTMNMPERRNALSLELREALIAAVRRLSADENCRVIILTGSGGQFCAGGDIKSVPQEPDAERTRRNILLLQDIVRPMIAGPKPVIAAVEGNAFGAGMSLACACDQIIAAKSARFCAAFGRVGLMADSGLLWTLPQRIGMGRTRELLFTAREVDASEALAMGLADQVVADGEALAVALKLAQTMSKLAPLSLAEMKSVLARAPENLEAVFAAEAEGQPRLSLTADYAEGRAAFAERRKPVFRGR